jgi:phosphatidylcholine synthase
MKTADNYFRGFPALWNLIAFYLFVVGAGPAAGAVTTIAFVALTFAPVHFVHPFRVRGYGRWLPLLAALWSVATVALLWPDPPAALRWALLGVSLGTAAIMLGMGFRRSLRGDRAIAD